MVSKFDRLRAGEVVEIEPGRKGRLNLETKVFETSDGRRMFVGNDEDFFPKDEESLLLSREREGLQRDINKTPGGEFFFQMGQSGGISGLKDWGNRITMKGDEYLRNKKAQQQISEKISENSPWTSRAATVASFVPDIVATRGLSALKAAPLIAGVSAGSRVLDEPAEVAKEAALAAGGGYLLDKGTNWLSKAAQRRGLSRDIIKQGENVRKSNIAGEAETQAANQAAKQAFQKETQWAERENAARSHQYNLEINQRQNEMIRAQRAYDEAKAAHASNVNVLKEEAKATQKAYEESVRKLPELQREAQQQFSKGLDATFKDIEGAFPKGTRIPTDDLNVWGFYNDYVQKNGLVGTAEARSNQQLFRSLFPNGKTLSPKEFGDRLRAIEASIGKSSPESQKLLSEFKEYLAVKAPPIVGEAIVTRSTMPAIVNAVEGEVASILKGNPFSGIHIHSGPAASEVKRAMKDYVSGLSPKELAARAKSGQFAQDVRNKIFPKEKFESFLTNADHLQKMKEQGLYQYVKNTPEFVAQEKAYEAFINNLAQRSENAVARTQLQGVKEAGNAKANLTRKLRKTHGMAEPIPMPPSPEPMVFPEAPIPPMEPPIPMKPSMVESPSAPIPRQFMPQEAPVLPGAQGSAEMAGDFLEKPLLQGKGNMNNLLKLGALKYALGPAALPLEGAAAGLYGAGKLLTSPGAIGQAARMSFKQGGIQAIEMLAQKYPSYHDGILENPQERRSLTKEIEDDPEIPIEQKAILQSKINRGKPIMQKLQ